MPAPKVPTTRKRRASTLENRTALDKKLDGKPPLREVRELWFVVLLDCLAAVCSIAPILCVPAMWYLVMNYSVTWVQFRQEKTSKRLKCVNYTVAGRAADVARILAEVMLWVWLTQCNVRAWMDLLRFVEILSDKNASSEETAAMLKNIVQYTQVNFIRSSLCVCTVFFRRSFQIHSADALRAVAEQKRWNNAKLKKRETDKDGGFKQALQVLKSLKTKKPWNYYFQDPPMQDETDDHGQLHGGSEKQRLLQDGFQESTAQPNRAPEQPEDHCQPQEAAEPEGEKKQRQAGDDRLNLAIVVLSTLGLAVGVLFMSVGLELSARNKLFEDQGEMTFGLSWWWLNMSASVALMSDGWARLLWSLLKATDSFRDNITQVLIFSCLGRLTSWSHLSRGLESYSYRNRCRAKRLLEKFATEVEVSNDLSDEETGRPQFSKTMSEVLQSLEHQQGPRSRTCPCFGLAPTLTCGEAKVFYELLQHHSCQLSFANDKDLQAW